MNCLTHRVLILSTIGLSSNESMKLELYNGASFMTLRASWPIKAGENLTPAALSRMNSDSNSTYREDTHSDGRRHLPATALRLTLFRTDGTTDDIDLGFVPPYSPALSRIFHHLVALVWLACIQSMSTPFFQAHFNISCSFRGILREIWRLL